MSRFRLPSLRKAASSVKNAWSRSRRSTRWIKPRRLQIDPLEERQLLSLAPADTFDVLVNEHHETISVGTQQYTDPISGLEYPMFVAEVGTPTTNISADPRVVGAGQVIGADDDGDFVAVWSRTDEVRKLSLNPDGTVRLSNGAPVYEMILDPQTGAATLDSNVYARYFTDEVQRVTLPDQVLGDNNPNQAAKFSLTFGGNEVQKLSITAAYSPSLSFGFGFQSPIAGTFTLGFDLDGSGTIGPGETRTIIYDELNFAAADPAARPGNVIETQLRGLGGPLSDVEVEALNPHEYLIHFGDASLGQNEPEIVVQSSNFTSGFFPAVMASTESEPITLADIPISPTDPAHTATLIKGAFQQTIRDYLPPPWVCPAATEIANWVGSGFSDGVLPEGTPTEIRRGVAEVVVTPVFGIPGHADGTVFDVTFVGNSGKKDQPEMAVPAVQDEMGNSLITSSQLSVRTTKQSSPEFRVNPDEPFDPLLGLPILTDQYSPAVAVDADGDFTITWTSEVPEDVNPGSVTDVFARRFSPVAVVPESQVQFFSHEDADGVLDPVQGVRALGGEFRVNSTTTNRQMSPTVGMDADGNFVIAWANVGQDLSFFNGIIVQRYNRDGDRVGGEFRVTQEMTAVHLNPFAAMARDGTFAIAWETSEDPAYFIPSASYVTRVSAQVFGPSGTRIATELAVGGGGDPSLAFDTGNNMYVSWEVLGDADGAGPNSEGGRGQMYRVDAAANSVTIIRDTFRTNSATTAGLTPAPTWPLHQYSFQIGVDSDGDIMATYVGYGPDASVDVFIDGNLFADLINSQTNADLLPYFDPSFAYLPYNFSGNLVDVDGVIEGVLINAVNSGATDSQVGRLAAILEQVAGKLRGEANGLLFSRWDADPNLGQMTVLTSDNVGNSYRDGHNSRYFIAFDPTTNGGSFILRLYHPDLGGYEDTAAITFDRNLNNTRNNIHNALTALNRVFDAYAEVPTDGPVAVRFVGSFEVLERQGTPWELSDGFNTIFPNQIVFEITFQGSAHDKNLQLYVVDNSLTSPGTNEVQILSFYPASTADQDGWFALQLGANTTADIYFNPSNLAGVALQIQAAIANINTAIPPAPPVFPYAGVQVTALPGGPPYQFQVVFGGVSGGVNQPPINGVPPQQIIDRFLPPPYSQTIVNGGATTAPPIGLLQYMSGYEGVEQAYAGMAVQPGGSFVAAWTQFEEYTYGGLSNNNIYYRRFAEDTDTAGPLVTDFLLPTGQRLRNGDQVNLPLQYIVVTLDEEMMRAGPNAVTNPQNWALIRNGVDILGGISKVEFGMNRSVDLGNAGLGLNTIGSNKWEAILYLDGDGLAGDTLSPLSDGHYQVVAKNSLRDKAGNALGRTGFNPNGLVFTRDFDVLVPRAQEVRVNDDAAGVQSTPEFSPQATVSDGSGHTLVGWTSDKAGEEGVWIKLYGVTWAEVDGERESQWYDPLQVVDPVTGVSTVIPAIHVTDDPTATYASVARDADGDLVVTWSQKDPDPRNPLLITDWNVWARRYKATGEPLGPAFRVNSEIRNVQRYSTVAMDVEGDFVITWQSQSQDKSGYGIYAQRYSPAGDAIGGDDEIQAITFRGNPRGHFILLWDHDKDPGTPLMQSGDIPYNGNTVATADRVQQELEAMGAEVVVQAISRTEIVIRFVGRQGSSDQEPIQLLASITSGDPDRDILIATRADGTSGEFRVNDTTTGNQLYPSIAMAADGTFVVTWTSYGQGSDQAFETNVYAKKFISNQLLRPGSGSGTPISFGVDNGPVPLIVSTDDPGNHVVGPGSGYDGVVQVNLLGQGMGSGTLLSTGMHILTAAHVVTPQGIPAPYPAGAISVTFNLPTGDVVVPASRIDVNPTWSWVMAVGGDVAVITLASPAPPQAERHDIYRLADEIGRVGQKYGYGYYGVGITGETFPYFGTKRQGENRYEALGNQLPGAFQLSNDYLIYDFDDGTPEHDAFGNMLGIPNLGLGDREAMAAHGDSGGPTFINGLIAGVTSWGWTFGPPIEVSPNFSSFGWFGGDTRVSFYASWIDGITLGGTGEFLVNQTQLYDQKWSTVAMDSDGDFVVTWTSYGQDGGSYGSGFGGLNGIVARRFSSDTQPASNEFVVNTFTEGNQQHPRIAMDSDGDFVVAWESFQDRPPPGSGLPDSPNSYGVYAQRYARTALVGTSPLIGPNGEVSTEFAVNVTKDGDQRYPGVAVDQTGDFAIVWSGNGPEDDQGVFYQRFENLGDNAGPIVTDVLSAVDAADGQVILRLIRDGSAMTPIKNAANRFVLEFDEELLTTGGVNGQHSILNPINWDLSVNGRSIRNGVSTIHFGLSQVRVEWQGTPGNPTKPSGKFQAVITVDADPSTPGLQPLTPGSYDLTLRDTVQDLFGNPLDGDYDGTPGGDFHRTFTVSGPLTVGTPGPGDPKPGDKDIRVNRGILPPPMDAIWMQDSPAIAADDDGNYVVVWVDYLQYDPVLGALVMGFEGNVVAQRFNRFGQRLGTEFIVHTYVQGNQSQPDVAMDPFGNFVVVWAGEGTQDTTGVYARRFDPYGVPLGTEFLVNHITTSTQNRPAAAVDGLGNFVISWTRYDGGNEFEAVAARRFDSSGNPIFSPGDPLKGEFRVNTYTKDAQDYSDVATDADGNFLVVWQSQGQDGSSWGVYGQRYSASGAAVGGEFRVNTTTNDKQSYAKVAMDADGDFVVSWSSFLQDGSGYGVYARRYNNAGQPKDASEFRVNQTTSGWQHQPWVGMSKRGDFVVTWTAFGQESPGPKDYGIFARIYYADGSDFVDPANGLPLGEFRINAITLGDQVRPAVAMDADGDFGVVWEGPDDPIYSPLYPPGGRDVGVYLRTVIVNQETASTTASGDGAVLNGLAGWSGGWSDPFYDTGPLSLMLNGTAGDDTFVFKAGATPDTWLVKVNDAVETVDLRTAMLTFDGRGGYDTVVFEGTSGAEKLEAWTNHAILTGNGFTFNVANCESINAVGKGGADDVLFHDSDGNDTFAAGPASASLTGAGFSFNTTGFSRAEATSTAGNDLAVLTDSAGNDTFTAYPDYAQMSGTGFFLKANAFKTVQAQSFAGGDIARLYDSAGNDTFVAMGDDAATGARASGTLSGTGFSNQATGFRYLYAYATGGGTDTAKLYDSSGNDTFTADPTYGAMYSTTFYNRANTFEKVEGYARSGVDIARLSGSTGSDSLQADPQNAVLFGNGFSAAANKFRYVLASGNGGGGDVARLTDSAATEILLATPTYSTFSGPGSSIRLSAFPTVEVTSTNGGGDTARLYDSAGNDTFTAYPDTAVLSGAGYSNRVNTFRYVHAYGSSGTDTARFYDSSGTDTFLAYPAYAALYGSDYYNRANNFDSVEAVSALGADVAKFYDSAANDTFVASPTSAVLSDGVYAAGAFTNSTFLNRATNFRYVDATSKWDATRSGGRDVAELSDSADNDTLIGTPTYTTITNGTYVLRANKFSDVRVRASAGYDTAMLRDSALNDLVEAEDNWVRLSNVDLDYAITLYDFDKVTVNGSNQGDKKKIVVPLDFILETTGSWTDL